MNEYAVVIACKCGLTNKVNSDLDTMKKNIEFMIDLLILQNWRVSDAGEILCPQCARRHTMSDWEIGVAHILSTLSPAKKEWLCIKKKAATGEKT